MCDLPHDVVITHKSVFTLSSRYCFPWHRDLWHRGERDGRRLCCPRARSPQLHPQGLLRWFCSLKPICKSLFQVKLLCRLEKPIRLSPVTIYKEQVFPQLCYQYQSFAFHNDDHITVHLRNRKERNPLSCCNAVCSRVSCSSAPALGYSVKDLMSEYSLILSSNTVDP